MMFYYSKVFMLLLFSSFLYCQTELPRTNKKEQVVYHSGFTLSYNETYEQASWVAYELTANELIKKVNRSNNFKKDPKVKTVWSCCIVDMDTKSKRLNKTANECTYQEVLNACFFQINQVYYIPYPKIITTSRGLKNINDKWVSKNTGYTKNTYDDLNQEDLSSYFYPSDSELKHIGTRGIYLGNYLRWDPKAQHEKMIKLFN